MNPFARYDGVAEWYERELVNAPPGTYARQLAHRLLGPGSGRLLDVGCGGGLHSLSFRELGWAVAGIDSSRDQVQLALERGLDVTHGDASELPYEDDSFAAAVSMWTHTDVDDFAGVIHEVARVLRPGARFVYVGAHPCFVGPHSWFVGARGLPQLHPGYWETRRYTEAPGVSPTGLRAKVGAVHMPLGLLLQAFLDVGFVLERFEELEVGEYPWMLGLRCRK